MQNTILYIDDEAENLAGFKAVFRKQYQILTASNTQIAREILQDNDIHLIITDQRMPEENGLDFLSKIKPIYPDIICMILTAYSDIQNVLEAINQGGIYRYILKPWEKAEMQMAIDSAIETYNLKRQNQILVEELKLKNIEIKKSEEKFKNIFNTSVDAVFITTNEGKFLDINQTAVERVGISKEKFLEMSIFDLVDENAGNVEANLRKASSENYIETSTSYINPITEKRIHIETRSTSIDYNGMEAILHIARDVTERLLMEKTLLKTIIETEEKERFRIARELHDGVSPVLAATRLYARLFTSGKDKNLEPVILEKLEETIDEAILSITEISNNMSPHILQNFGLSVALENFIEKLKNTQHIKFSVLDNYLERFQENIETMLYRISIELINNTIKYAAASEVLITFGKEATWLYFIYSDNGCGFDWEQVRKTSKGMGYYNILSRIKMLNGSVIINSDTRPGMEVKITIPLTKDE